jgi:hypothetical protein
VVKRIVKIIILYLMTLSLWGMGLETIYAANEVISTGTGRTDISAGIMIDYMGILRFQVRDKDTLEPVEGAFIELYVKGLNKYILFGQSDENGIYQLDISYDQVNEEYQYMEKDGHITYIGSLAYFEESLIKWKVYKEGYQPYPETGEANLKELSTPYQIDVYLYKEQTKPPIESEIESEDSTESSTQIEPSAESENSDKSGGNLSDNGGNKSGNTGQKNSGKMPKTGIERAVTLWSIGAGLCLVALSLILILWRRHEKDKK